MKKFCTMMAIILFITPALQACTKEQQLSEPQEELAETTIINEVNSQEEITESYTTIIGDFDVNEDILYERFGQNLTEHLFYRKNGNNGQLTYVESINTAKMVACPLWQEPKVAGTVQMPQGEDIIIIKDKDSYWSVGVSSDHFPNYYDIYRNIYSPDSSQVIIGSAYLQGYFLSVDLKKHSIIFVSNNGQDIVDEYLLPEGDVRVIGSLYNSYYLEHPYSLKYLIEVGGKLFMVTSTKRKIEILRLV